jgi:O-acetyl-ADP-ribose deacetylase (regulator of RNase III)
MKRPKISYVDINVRDVKRGIIAHGVNCQGVMGSGIALAIRDRWPEAYAAYHQYWVINGPPTQLLGDWLPVKLLRDLWVCHCFTQLTYGRTRKQYADTTAIEGALQPVFDLAEHLRLPVYLPRIGCGLGGLDWELNGVKLIVERAATWRDAPVETYVISPP